jgi:hypothetical protein
LENAQENKMKTKLKTYKNQKAFRKDCKWMQVKGWHVISVEGHVENQGIIKTVITGVLFLPWAFRKNTKINVIYGK